jgi:hypothetical protein
MASKVRKAAQQLFTLAGFSNTKRTAFVLCFNAPLNLAMRCSVTEGVSACMAVCTSWSVSSIHKGSTLGGAEASSALWNWCAGDQRFAPRFETALPFKNDP